MWGKTQMPNRPKHLCGIKAKFELKFAERRLCLSPQLIFIVYQFFQPRKRPFSRFSSFPKHQYFDLCCSSFWHPELNFIWKIPYSNSLDNHKAISAHQCGKEFKRCLEHSIKADLKYIHFVLTPTSKHLICIIYFPTSRSRSKQTKIHPENACLLHLNPQIKISQI